MLPLRCGMPGDEWTRREEDANQRQRGMKRRLHVTVPSFRSTSDHPGVTVAGGGEERRLVWPSTPAPLRKERCLLNSELVSLRRSPVSTARIPANPPALCGCSSRPCLPTVSIQAESQAQSLL